MTLAVLQARMGATGLPGEDQIRWTVARPDDYAFVATVYDHLYPANRAFSSADIKAFVAKRPDLLMYGGDRRG